MILKQDVLSVVTLVGGSLVRSFETATALLLAALAVHAGVLPWRRPSSAGRMSE